MDENEVKVPRNLSGQLLFDFMLIDMAAVTELYTRKRRAWLDQHAAAISEEQLKKFHRYESRPV